MEPTTTSSQFLTNEPERTDGGEPASLAGEHGRIVHTPDVCGGKPRIAGHRITVKHLVLDRQRGGMSDEQIIASYPGVARADLAAAFAYYRDHRDEIDADIRADDEHWSEIDRRDPGSVMDQIRRRQADVANDTLPPR